MWRHIEIPRVVIIALVKFKKGPKLRLGGIHQVMTRQTESAEVTIAEVSQYA
jgi:hypothetical protein